jgi:hypothetical protein
LCPELGQNGRPAGGASVPGGGSRGSFGSGERGARPRQGAARVGPRKDGEAPKGFARHWRGARWKVRRRQPWWHGGAGRSGGGRGARARWRAAV